LNFMESADGPYSTAPPGKCQVNLLDRVSTGFFSALCFLAFLRRGSFFSL
jgi:hypothetical protein